MSSQPADDLSSAQHSATHTKGLANPNERLPSEHEDQKETRRRSTDTLIPDPHFSAKSTSMVKSEPASEQQQTRSEAQEHSDRSVGNAADRERLRPTVKAEEDELPVQSAVKAARGLLEAGVLKERGGLGRSDRTYMERAKANKRIEAPLLHSKQEENRPVGEDNHKDTKTTDGAGKCEQDDRRTHELRSTPSAGTANESESVTKTNKGRSTVKEEEVPPTVAETQKQAEKSKRNLDEVETSAPQPKKARKYEEPPVDSSIPKQIAQIPLSRTYTRSFMHRKAVSHVVTSRSCDFVITASIDGHLKFWKRRNQELEFVKTYRSHVGPVQSVVLNHNESQLMTLGQHDNTLKLYSVLDFDMISRTELPFAPEAAVFVHGDDHSDSMVAISDRESESIHMMPLVEQHTQQSRTKPFKRHMKGPVHILVAHPAGFIISTDRSGGIEFWVPNPRQDYPPANANTHAGVLKFKYKSETDLYCLQKDKTFAVAMCLSPSGQYLAILGADDRLRVLRVRTGKRWKVLDESLTTQCALQAKASEGEALKLNSADFEKRLLVEKDLLQNHPESVSRQTICIDPTERYLLYPTVLGIKVLDLVENRLVGIVGKNEAQLRFLAVTLVPQGFEGNKLVGAAVATGYTDQSDALPLLVATAFKAPRLFVFTPFEVPTDGTRDMQNETLVAEDAALGSEHKSAMSLRSTSKAPLIRRAARATIHTTYGDIKVVLFPDECPRTVENFATHAQRKYYDGVVFHRVIRGFMIQTGDPRGDGTGGESIWGGEFGDEFCRKLKHDRPYTLSMANAGPNTNGSQFFITTVPTPFLDSKHTVFGRVEDGMNVVHEIEESRTNLEDRPLKDIKILTIRITEEAPRIS